MMGGQQIIILKEGTEREKGKGAVYNNIAAARAVADAVSRPWDRRAWTRCSSTPSAT